MKNIFIAVSLFLSSLLMGDNIFIGGNHISSSFAFTIHERGRSGTLSFDGTGLIGKVGKINKKRRFYVDFGNHWEKEELSYLHMFSINYDKLFSEQDSLIPFIGVGIGYGKFKSSKSEEDIDAGIDYSIRAGVLFNIDKNSGLEFQYGYMIPFVKDKGNGATSTSDKVIKGIYVGYNYTF